MNVASVAVLEGAANEELAERFVRFLLSTSAQEYFAEETYEYPLASGVGSVAGLPPLEDLNPPDIDLSDLSDLQGTLQLLRDTGALP